ncbi:Transcription initiation factor IIF subunit alpha [Entamoeba marina]
MSKIPVTVNKGKQEDEIVLSRFDFPPYEKLVQPLQLVKDVADPEPSNKNESKRREYYKKNIRDAPYLLKTANEELQGRKEVDKYAVIQVKEGRAIINIVNEIWKFQRKDSKGITLSSVPINTEKDTQRKSKVKQRRRTNDDDFSDSEQNSHMSEEFEDDHDDFNTGDMRSDSYSSNDNSEEENEERKRQSESEKPKAKQDLREKIIKIMKEKGDEMYLEELYKELNVPDNDENKDSLVKAFSSVLDVHEDNGSRKIVYLKDTKASDHKKTKKEHKKTKKESKK